MAQESGEFGGGGSVVHGGLSATEENYGNYFFQCMNTDSNGGGDSSVFGFECHEAANNIIRATPKENSEQLKMADTLLRLHPLGLKLNLSPTLLDSVEKKLYYANCEAKATLARADDFVSQPISEKLKASNFPASLLKIGAWQRISRNEGDLVAKCYYAKRKLVWEILEGRLKRKIEIQWTDILSMRAVTRENESGILEIELSQRPAFYEEIDPQPRKHTMWKVTADFTGGQASNCRRHHLIFPPGSLDKHYEKLLQCDERLSKLSKIPFPSLQSADFPDGSGLIDSAFGYNGGVPDVDLGLRFTFSNIPSSLVTSQCVQSYKHVTQTSFKETPSPISVMDFAHSDEHISNQVFENPRMALWGRGINNQGLVPGASSMQVTPATYGQSHFQTNPAVSCPNYAPVSCQDYDLSTYGQGMERPNFDAKCLSDLENHLFSDSQVEGYDESYHLARVESLCALVDLSAGENRASKSGSVHTSIYGQVGGLDKKSVLSANDCSNGIGGQFYQQPVSSMPPKVSPGHQMMHPSCNDLSYAPGGQFYQQQFSSMPQQVSPENQMMHQPCNNTSYDSVIADPRMESFDPVRGVNSWT